MAEECAGETGIVSDREYRERAVLHDGDVVTIGATTFIVHIPNEEDEEYFE